MKQSSRATARIVAADACVLRMQLAEPDAVVGSFCARDSRLRRAQLFIAVHDEIDGALIRGVELLRHVCEHQLRRSIETAGVGLQLVQHQRQQTRLARTVLTDDADLLATIDRE